MTTDTLPVTTDAPPALPDAVAALGEAVWATARGSGAHAWQGPVADVWRDQEAAAALLRAATAAAAAHPDLLLHWLLLRSVVIRFEREFLAGGSILARAQVSDAHAHTHVHICTRSHVHMQQACTLCTCVCRISQKMPCCNHELCDTRMKDSLLPVSLLFGERV